MVSKRELVEALVEAGLSAVDAEKFVTEAFEKWKQLKPNLEDYAIWDLVKTSVKLYSRKLRRYGGNKYEVLVLGVDQPRDIFDRFKRTAMRMYQEDPNKAILDGYVKVDDATGEVIPLDYRQELPDGRPNPNYGKPLPKRIVRDAIVVATQISENPEVVDRLAVLSGDLPDLEVGKRYTVTARPVERNNVLYLNYVPLGVEEAGVDDPKELYRELINLFNENDILIDLKTIENCEGYELVITKATVFDKFDTTKGSILTVDDPDNPVGGLTVFCTYNVECDVGSEVLITGRVIIRNGEHTINAFGVIVNPDTYEQFKEILIDLTGTET